MYKDVFEYITTEETNFKTVRIPLTSSKDWNMHEHIERCTNVANAWYHSGKNDGTRPYDDLVTPIINVAFRTEGFDVKDIVPFVDNAEFNYKSFLIKKFHAKWARENKIDTFIDDLVETSVIYDLALVKNVNDVVPEVVDLKSIAFCDQTDVLAGPICLKHYLTVEQLLAQKGKWDDDAIELAIYQAENVKKVSIANDQEAKTPSKYIEVYELRGHLPENWINDGGDNYNYIPQMHFVCYYNNENGTKGGITLFKGKDKPLTENFKALKIDRIRSKGRACGKSIVESLFEPQVWSNYSAIKIKNLLDSAFNVLITDSTEIASQNLKELKSNTILSQERGANTQRLTSDVSHIVPLQNYQQKQEQNARLLGSASESSLGLNPTSGTPFALQNLIVQEGQGIHEYRQGKIASFVADEIYKDWVLEWLVKDMNKGQEFSDVLSLDEMNEIAGRIVENQVNKVIKDKILNGTIVTAEEQNALRELYTTEFTANNRKFFELAKDDLKDLPMDVMVNIKGKQRTMAQNADKITNILRTILTNPTAFSQIPGVGKAFNQLLEESGMSGIDFTQVTSPQNVEVKTPEVAGEQLQVNQ